ncbi:hypothetical protein BDN67DRAFT_962189 [Paxillus ammoniavirescens]|nr:hypothetical protein BDN67DRAFT_962189 [Paxillus ammoniavirescens]
MITSKYRYWYCFRVTSPTRPRRFASAVKNLKTSRRLRCVCCVCLSIIPFLSWYFTVLPPLACRVAMKLQLHSRLKR